MILEQAKKVETVTIQQRIWSSRRVTCINTETDTTQTWFGRFGYILYLWGKKTKIFMNTNNTKKKRENKDKRVLIFELSIVFEWFYFVKIEILNQLSMFWLVKIWVLRCITMLWAIFEVCNREKGNCTFKWMTVNFKSVLLQHISSERW